MAKAIETYIEEHQPIYYMEVVEAFANQPHQRVVQGVGILYERGRLCRDDVGRYALTEVE